MKKKTRAERNSPRFLQTKYTNADKKDKTANEKGNGCLVSVSFSVKNGIQKLKNTKHWDGKKQTLGPDIAII